MGNGLSLSPYSDSLLSHDLFRICAGMHFAEASVFMAVVTCLATMNITKAKDTNGEDITPGLLFNGGLVK